MMTIVNNVRLPGREDTVDILIAGGKIAEIGELADCRFKNMRRIDAEGKTAVPGYIDQHVHVTGGGGEGGFSNRVPEIRPSDCVLGGVTTLVGVLGTDSETRSIENLVAKTKALREFGLTAYCLTGSYQYPSPTLTGSVEKDIVFIEEVIGVKIAVSDHRSSNISKEDMVRLASEARLGGVLSNKPGIVHMHMGGGKNGLGLIFDILETTDIPIGNFRPTHVGRIPDDAVRFAKMGGYIDFTAGCNAAETARQLSDTARLVPPGLITMSSDSNGSAPIWNEKGELAGLGIGRITALHDVVRSLVLEFGVALSDAVRPSTENVARALNLYPKKGVIREGSDADLLLVDGDCRIDTVIAGGIPMMERGVILKKGVFE